MTEKIDLFNKRLIEAVEQTMSLMTKSSSTLINALAKNLVLKINATDLDGQFPQAIYRAKRAYAQNRKKAIKLSGLYSQLFGSEKADPEAGHFSLIVNVDAGMMKEGFLWYSPESGKSYRMADLNYFILEGDDFVPYNMTAWK